MTEKTKENENNLKQEIYSLKTKIEDFSSILEKFGLDLITKIGQQNTKIHMLSDKIEELNKATIQIKALAPQLNNIIESQKYMESEIDLLKSLLHELKSLHLTEKTPKIEISDENEVLERKDAILNKFEELQQNLYSLKPPDLKNLLLNLKDAIFEYTGGHSMLYEISKFIQELKPEASLSEEFRTRLKEKLIYWKNKLN
ncbi:MAG: hypothetical protein ACTSYC_09480 [Promethearchaeota archaeon]